MGTNVPPPVGTRKVLGLRLWGDMWVHSGMPAEKMEPFKFRVRPSMLEQAQRIADKRGDNLSEVLRDGLKDYIRANAHLLTEDRDG